MSRHIGTIIDRSYFGTSDFGIVDAYCFSLLYGWQWGQFIFIPAQPMWGV